jgi:putative ABC transport system permease protein
MTLWNRFRSWLGATLRRSRMESEMDAEMRFHMEAYAEDLVRGGVPHQEAMRRARLEFWGIERAKEECREERGVRVLETLLQDLRYAARMLRKSPGFTTVAVLTLALGIGANTAIFSALNTLLLRPLPVENVERLAFIVSLREGFDPFGTSLLEYTAYRDRSHSFVSTGLATERSFNLIQQGEPERVQGAAVLSNYLSTLGVQPVIGRSFAPEEERPGGPAVALMGYGLWQRRFGGDPHVVGRSLDLEGRNTTVIGILPPTFDLPEAAEIWIPLQANLEGLPLAERAKHAYYMVARLKPGASLQQADADLRGIARELEQELPQIRSGWSVKLISLRQQLLGDLTGQVKTSLFALVAAVGFLLFICCANVASLLLARGVSREREIALRRALGADWLRVVRQLLTECLVLAALGGFGGLLLAYAILPVLSVLNPIETVALSGVLRNIHIDGHVLGFVASVTLITAVICALMPVVKAAGSDDVGPLMKEGGQRGSAGSGGRRWLATLVVAEIAIAMPLLAGSGLMIQSFQRLQRIDLGFRPENLLTMHLDLSPIKYREYQQRVTFVERVVERIKNLPGVVSAGTTTNMPLTLFISYDSVFTVEGHPPANPSDVPITAHRVVTPDYLQTLGVTLIKGRLLNEQDRAKSLPVVVISEELARQGWPAAEDPVGKRIKGLAAGRTVPWLTVVGIIKDIKEDRFNFRINRPAWYVPYEQNENTQPLDLLVKANGDPSSLAAAIVEAVRSVDPDQPVSNVTTMKDHVAGVLVTDRFGAVLMGTLAALGLMLAVIGVYGVMAYSVSRQTGEMGLRVALGARPSDILKMVVGRGARLVAVGLSVGLVGALILTRFLSGSLYGMNPDDPLTFGLVSLILTAVALAACYIPARRAMRVDPMVALRYE